MSPGLSPLGIFNQFYLMLFNAGLGIYCEQNRPDTFVLYQYQFQCLPVSVNNHLITRHVAQLTWTAGGTLAAARTHQGKNWTDTAGTSEGCEVFVSLVRAFLGNLLLIKQTFRIEAEYLNIHLWDDQFPVWCAGLPSPVRECRRCAGQTGDTVSVLLAGRIAGSC